MKSRSIQRLAAGLSLLALASLAACANSAVPPSTAPSASVASPPLSSIATPPSTPASASASAAPSSLPPQGAGNQKRAYPIVAGSSCAGHGRAEDPGRPLFHRTGTTWTREERWGCGCPTRDVFTMVYEPKTSPLRVRLCVDPEADRCEALCTTDLSWNLEGPMREAGATDVTFVE